MTLDVPTLFREALLSRSVRAVMPTNFSTDEIQAIPVDIRERSLFSARNHFETVLNELGSVVDRILAPTTKTSEREIDAGQQFTSGLDVAQARVLLREKLAQMGYEPDAAKAGGLQDLGSDVRLDLVINTNVEMAQGFGQWRQGQDEDVLDAFPAQELYRLESRMVPRNWAERWNESASAVDPKAGDVFSRTGRMIARKDSPIWESISRFSQPYPPFDFNSGMDVRDVDYQTAVKLGVVERGAKIEPQRRGFEMTQGGAA